MGASRRGGRDTRPPARGDAAAVLPFPGRRERPPRPRRLDSIAHRLPSGRALLATAVLVALLAGGYLVARDTSLFAVRQVEIAGAPPGVAAEVRDALRPFVGTSLVALDGAAVDAAVGALPDVVAVHHDRDFPHTLRLYVVPERPVAVVRQGDAFWVVSARGRVLRRLVAGTTALPRIWVRRSVDLSPGTTLADQDGGRAARSLGPLAAARLGVDVRLVRFGDNDLTWLLSRGREIRLGDASELPLKLAIVKRILPDVADGEYVDVSVPERPVAGPVRQAPPPAAAQSSAAAAVAAPVSAPSSTGAAAAPASVPTGSTTTSTSTTSQGASPVAQPSTSTGAPTVSTSSGG